MQKQKRILICPLDWGLGHATRCIPIIRLLLKKNAEVVIAADAGPLALLKQEFPQLTFVQLKGYNIQYPKSGSSVKEGRKIYLTIVTEKAPMVKVPDVIGRSTSSAKNQLLSAQLVAGQSEIIAALEENTVLKMKFNGQEIKPGTLIPKGSTVVFVVGDGLGDQMIEVPNLVGMAADEAEILASGQNLVLSKRYVGTVEGSADGTIVKQRPSAEGNKIRIGDVIDVEIAGDDPAGTPPN